MICLFYCLVSVLIFWLMGSVGCFVAFSSLPKRYEAIINETIGTWLKNLCENIDQSFPFS
jgi:hypothetical protein